MAFFKGNYIIYAATVLYPNRDKHWLRISLSGRWPAGLSVWQMMWYIDFVSFGQAIRNLSE